MLKTGKTFFKNLLNQLFFNIMHERVKALFSKIDLEKWQNISGKNFLILCPETRLWIKEY